MSYDLLCWDMFYIIMYYFLFGCLILRYIMVFSVTLIILFYVACIRLCYFLLYYAELWHNMSSCFKLVYYILSPWHNLFTVINSTIDWAAAVFYILQPQTEPDFTEITLWIVNNHWITDSRLIRINWQNVLFIWGMSASWWKLV